MSAKLQFSLRVFPFFSSLLDRCYSGALLRVGAGGVVILHGLECPPLPWAGTQLQIPGRLRSQWDTGGLTTPSLSTCVLYIQSRALSSGSGGVSHTLAKAEYLSF